MGYAELERVWEHEGYRCAVVMVGNSHRCGYVEVPEDHIAYKIRSYEDIPVDVHGGLTFGDENVHPEIESRENTMWFGFDCAHAGDQVRSIENDGHWWTEEEVVAETEKLAEQMKQMTWRDAAERKLKYKPEWFKKMVKIVD